MAMHDCAWVVCIRCMGARAIGKKDPRPSSRNNIPLNYPHRWPREGDLTRWVAPETSRARLVLLYIHSPTHTHPRPRATHASDHRRPGFAAPPAPTPPPARPHKRERPPGFPPEASRSVARCGAATGAGRGNPVPPWRGRPQGSRRRRGCGGAWSGSDQEDEQGDGEDDTQGDADQHASTHARSTGSPDPVGRSAS